MQSLRAVPRSIKSRARNSPRRLDGFVDRCLRGLDRRSEVAPGDVPILIRREDATGAFVHPSLDVLPGRTAYVAPLAFVPDRTLAQSQEGFRLVRPDEDSDGVEWARFRTGHRYRNPIEGQIDDEKGPGEPGGGADPNGAIRAGFTRLAYRPTAPTRSAVSFARSDPRFSMGFQFSSIPEGESARAGSSEITSALR